jgi:BirA family biotin operon repressor/biotin-[acetyl-CoA-carboxylase] ligase
MTLRESPRLTSLLAEVVAATIAEETGCAPTIKPPNDIYISSVAASLCEAWGSGRKVAGVLVEGRTTSDGNYLAVAGIGINVNQMLDDFPKDLRGTAGSLAMAAGRKVSRMKVAIALLRKLDDVAQASCLWGR